MEIKPIAIVFLLFTLFINNDLFAQLDEYSIMGIPKADDEAEILAISFTDGNLSQGAIVFNKANKKIYVFDGTGWRKQVSIKVSDITATTYTLLESDDGNIITFNNASAITLEIPADLPVGFSVSIYQKGAGKVQITGATGVNLVNRLSRFYTAGVGAGAGIVCLEDNEFYITGDLKRY